MGIWIGTGMGVWMGTGIGMGTGMGTGMETGMGTGMGTGSRCLPSANPTSGVALANPAMDPSALAPRGNPPRRQFALLAPSAHVPLAGH